MQKKLLLKKNYFQEYWGIVSMIFYHPVCPEEQGLLVWKKEDKNIREEVRLKFHSFDQDK